MAWHPNSNPAWPGLPDGNWSAFVLEVGRPPQFFHAVPSVMYTTLRIPFVADCDPNAVPGDDTGGNGDLRRDIGRWEGDAQTTTHFQPSLSKSWLATIPCSSGIDAIDDQNLDDAKRSYRYRVQVEASTLHDEIVSCGAGERHVLAPPLLGIKAVKTEYEGNKSYYADLAFDERSSLLQAAPFYGQDMEIQPGNWKWIDLGYSYTAGAWYRQCPGSLGFGSYEKTRLDGDASIIIPFSDNEERLLNLTVLSISVSTTLNSSRGSPPVLASPVPAVLDMTRPFLELPETVCYDLQESFGLEYNSTYDLFLVNSTQRDFLRGLSPLVRIEISNGGRGNNSQTLNITLPYAAFDHEIQLCDGEFVPYFPIKVAKPERGNVLGRVFFQEAHLMVSYGSLNFTLSQASFPPSCELVRENVVWMEYFEQTPEGWDKFERFLRPNELGEKFFIVVMIVLLSMVLWLIVAHALPYILLYSKRRRLSRREMELEMLWVEIHGWGSIREEEVE